MKTGCWVWIETWTEEVCVVYDVMWDVPFGGVIVCNGGLWRCRWSCGLIECAEGSRNCRNSFALDHYNKGLLENVRLSWVSECDVTVFVSAFLVQCFSHFAIFAGCCCFFGFSNENYDFVMFISTSHIIKLFDENPKTSCKRI